MKCPKCDNEGSIYSEAMDEWGLCLNCIKEIASTSVAKQITRRMKQIGVPNRYLDAQITDFPKDVIKDIDSAIGYFLVGPVDTGKTHLLAALCRDRLLQLERCMWIKAPMFFADVRESPDKGTDLIKRVCNIPYLFVDDLGAERVTDWVFECWYRIIDYRYSQDMHLSVTLNKVDSLDERLFRRLRDMTTLLEMEDR